MDIQYENWIEKTKQFSLIVSEYLLNEIPDDSFGWGARMSTLARQLPDENISGLLLTGPDGCGKHTCVSHFIRELKNDDFEPVFLNGSSFKKHNVSALGATELIGALLDDFYDRNKGICLVLDQLEGNNFYSEVLDYLCEIVCEYHLMRNEYPPFFVIIIKKEPAGVPALLSTRLLQCNMTLPTASQRRAFFEGKAKMIKKCVDFEKIVMHTDGFSYNDLLSLIRNVTLELDSRRALAIEDSTLEELIKAQSASNNKADCKADFFKKAEEFIESFLILTERLANQKVQAVTFTDATQRKAIEESQQQDGQTNAINLEMEWQKSENMPVKQLVSEVLGEEDVERLLRIINH